MLIFHTLYLSLFLSLLRKDLASPASLTNNGCFHCPISLISIGVGVSSLFLTAAPIIPSPLAH